MVAPPAEAIEWLDGSAVAREDGSVELDVLAAAKASAKAAKRPVAILALTRRDFRATEQAAGDAFVQNVLGTADVAKKLNAGACIRVYVDELPSSLRRELHLTLAAPQLVFIHPDGGSKLALCDGGMTEAQVVAQLVAATKRMADDKE